MKRILLFLALAAFSMNVQAQNRDQLISSIEKAKKATLNEKKASNPVTWIKLGDAYVNAYTALKGDAWIGMTKNEAMFLGVKPVSEEQKKLSNGAQYNVEHYEFRDLYYNANGVLDAIVVTKPLLDEGLLVLARQAYMKAIELDTKGAKKKDLSEKLLSVRDKFVDDAMSFYTLGNIEKAAQNFESSLPCQENEVVSVVDSTVVYYTGVTYNALGNKEKAKKYFTKCMEMGYFAEGDIPAALAEIVKSEGNVELAKEYLSQAFQKYPSSQPVLISLINLFIETNDNPEKILNLIRTAQANEPKNGSLYYAEGNVHKNLGDIDKAIECYYKSTEIDPNYSFGIYSVGNTYFDLAIEVQEEMNKLDINDVENYEKLSQKFEKYLLDSMEPFEKAFEIAKENDLKIAAASALKQICFRFRTKEAKFKDGYEKYSAFLAENGVE